MTLYGLPLLFTLLVWWFSTGAIFFLDSRPRWTFPWSFGAVTLLAAASVLAIARAEAGSSAADAYAAFTCGLVLWGWLETGFYMGFLVGPRRTASEERATGWRRLREAMATTLYHEVAAGAVTVLLLAISWDLPQKLALWTFVTLWIMQLSAKLNVFLGVRNLAENMLPAHLAFLQHYMTRKPMNPAFPVTVTGATLATLGLAGAALAAVTAYEAAAFTLLATLAALAVLEHWMLVLPLRVDVLWRWALPPQGSVPTAERSRAGTRLPVEDGRPHGAPLGAPAFPLPVPSSLNSVAH